MEPWMFYIFGLSNFLLGFYLAGEGAGVCEKGRGGLTANSV